ncbi:hypothetical protein L1049_008776 [Liquidambar formosana]|uniref:Uncharacterized protein n=1 Tax=Liquidambar formosana TaxID=63359 RepID=A0AAP0X9J0_LIQFO
MGLDTDRGALGSIRSVSSGKQKKRNNNVANAKGVLHKVSPVAGKGEAKIPISPSISSGSEDSRNSKYKNGGKRLSRSEAGNSKSIRNLNVNTGKGSTDGGESRTPSVKGNGISNVSPASLASSVCDSKKRQPDLRSASSNEGSPKSLRTDKTHFRGATPPKGGFLSKNLSFGNICKPSSNSIPERDPPNLKDGHVNENGSGVRGPVGSIVEPNQSKKHVLGLGKCNYGYGSIVRGVKNEDNTKSNCEVTSSENITEKQRCLIPKSAPHFGSVEELKNAGNEEYKRGCFMEAISFYNKAIALCPQNAVCHNNKAAALAGLGNVTEAVGECLEAIRHDPWYSRAHYRLGTLYIRLGRVDDAKWHFKLSGQDNGSEVMQQVQRLEGYLRNMRKAQNIEDWDHVLTESTLSIKAGADASNQVVSVKAEALLKLHRAKEALALLVAARDSEENRSRKAWIGSSCLLIIETQVNLYLGRFEEGVVAAEQAVYLDSNAESLMWLKNARGVADARKSGNEFFRAGKYLEACTIYSHGLQYVPTNSVLLCNRAACRSKLGQWELAIDDCNAALTTKPNYSKALLRRAHSYARLKRWEESLRDYSVLRKEMPGDRAIADSLLQVEMELKMAQGAWRLRTSSYKKWSV